MKPVLWDWSSSSVVIQVLMAGAPADWPVRFPLFARPQTRLAIRACKLARWQPV